MEVVQTDSRVSWAEHATVLDQQKRAGNQTYLFDVWSSQLGRAVYKPVYLLGLQHVFASLADC